MIEPSLHMLFGSLGLSGAMPKSTERHKKSYLPNPTLPAKNVNTPRSALHSLIGTFVLMTFAFTHIPFRQIEPDFPEHNLAQ
jgi:hypothetical protein